MLLRDSHDESQTFKIKYHFKSFFVLFENSCGLLYQISHIKDFVMMIIKKLHKLFYQGTDFFSGADNVWLIHSFSELFISRF